MESRRSFFFVRNFNMTLAASGTLEGDTKFQCLCTLVRRKALRQFYSLSPDVESTETLNVDYIIRGLAQYFPPVNSISKQKRTMRRGIQKPLSPTGRNYAARLIDLN